MNVLCKYSLARPPVLFEGVVTLLLLTKEYGERTGVLKYYETSCTAPQRSDAGLLNLAGI